MNPAKVRRDQLHTLTDLPNVGPAMARDLQRLGFDHPDQLRGRNPQELYDRLCALTGLRQDPCVLDVFVSVIRFMDGEEPRPWWFYTPERKDSQA
jgi:hypothetical protein